MPIYEYECQKCGEIFEVMQKYSDPPPKTHKKCGSRRVKRIMSRSTFILKGTGWYVTDYARKDSGDKSSRKKKKGESSEGKEKKKSKKSSTAAANGKSAA